ncbi:MAG: hypothetical protein O3A47_09945 [Chloroflexi bacterium]|nr:hypothetical protein [Chloroflexota bacterium]
MGPSGTTRRIGLPSGGWWEIETRPRWRHARGWEAMDEGDLADRALAALTVGWSLDEEPTVEAVCALAADDLAAMLDFFLREVAPFLERDGPKQAAERLFAGLARGAVPADFVEAHVMAATGWSWQTLQETPADVVRDMEIYLGVSRAFESGGSLDFDTEE